MFAPVPGQTGQPPAKTASGRTRIPQTVDGMKQLLGPEYIYLVRDGLFIVSDLDDKTLYPLVTQDFLIYMYVLRRDFFNKPRKTDNAKQRTLLTIFLFKNRESYVAGLRKIGIDVAAEDENNIGAVRNGYYYPGKERNFILINYRDNFDLGIATYAHELSHALMRTELSNPPTWINEGLATMVGNSRVVNSHLQYIAGGSVRRTQKSLGEGALLALPEILLLTGKNFSQRENSLQFYDASEQLCRFLHSRDQLLPVYRALRDGGARDAGAEAIRRVTGLDQDALEKEWHDWLRKQKPPPGKAASGRSQRR
jgi:hypothetical protein